MPYRRKIILAKPGYSRKKNSRVVKHLIYRDFRSEFIKKYDPSHPACDEYGYVVFPNVNKDIERADIAEAKVSYEANLAVIKSVNDMMKGVVEVIK